MRSFRTRTAAVVGALMLTAACTGNRSAESAADPQGAGGVIAPSAALVTIPAPTDVGADPGVAAAVIDSDGQLGIVERGQVRNDWFKFDAFPSPDRSAAVLTLGPDISGIGPERPIVWVGLPSGERLGEQVMATTSELTATSLDGTYAGLTSRAGRALEGNMAGARRTSRIAVISRDDGLVFETRLDGNFVPEAFSRDLVDGLPSRIFLLEYFPAEAPRFYRVRVLSTETGIVSLPLNLRDKQQQVDERMAGFSRSQVVAHERGLLFTLYRGTVDGTPDGEPYAFVHTLDFADGVWCLEVDPQLELDRLPGSLAVGGDRLFVTSANGFVGSYPIPSITDPGLSPTMDVVVDSGTRSSAAPVVIADDEAVYVVDETRPGFLTRVSHTGDVMPPTMLAGRPEALTWDAGKLHAFGDGWATFDIEARPGWLDAVAHLVVG